MRIHLVLLVLLPHLAEADWFTHEETRSLRLDADTIAALQVESRHGFVVINGDESAEAITVTATIKVPRRSESEARKIISESLTLSLVSSDRTGILKGYFPGSVWRYGKGPSVSLAITVPERMSVNVDDGTGYITINDVHGDIGINDGDGSIELNNVGGLVRITDGSGWIEADRIGGDIHIEDRSGAISVTNVTGSVSIDDGSGRVSVSDVSEDLIIIDDDSGRLHFSDIGGQIKTES